MGGSLSSTTRTSNHSEKHTPSSDSPIPTDSQNPDSSANSLNPTMSSSSNNNQPLKQTPESSTIDSQKTLESRPQNPETEPQSSSDSSIDTKIEKSLEENEKVIDNGKETEGEGGEEEEEEGECGFCLFMKGGGCKESFIAWENCVEESEKNKEDVVEKCFEVTSILRKCMEAHADYYEPILRAEKAAQEEAVKELEREKASEQSKDSKGNGNVSGN